MKNSPKKNFISLGAFLFLLFGDGYTTVWSGESSQADLPSPGEESAGSASSGDATVPLSSLHISRAVQMWRVPHRDANLKGSSLRIAGETFDQGVGTHSFSRIFVHLGGKADRFKASVGMDDSAGGEGSVEFRIVGDGNVLWLSGVMRKGEVAKPVDIDVSRVDYLTLEVTDGGDGIHGDAADWADARFEGVRGRIAIIERLPEQRGKIVPGAAWRDTEGNLIQAHGGGVLYYDGKFYWYGEDRTEGYVAIGTSAYASEDLVNWTDLGVVLPASEYNAKWMHQNINERPKVAYNPRTKKFVMWFHWDRSGYWDSQAGVAIADRPEGPFRFLGMHRPVEESTYRDMNLFVDDDGTAYAIYAGEDNYTMHIVRLNEEWTAPERLMVEGETWIRTLIRHHREAPAPFKYKGKYYMITSGATGWTPNPGSYAVADSMLGDWKAMANPFVGPASDTTFGTQSTYVLPSPGKPGTFIYMGDRWVPSNLADSRYIWLPFEMKEDGTFEIKWRDSWEPGDFGFPEPKLVQASAVDKASATGFSGTAEPIDFSGQPMVYRLHDSQVLWPPEKRRRIVEAMNAAVALYNELGEFPKGVIASYNRTVPTADGNYNGNIRFGGTINRRVALHELGHVLGVGQHPRWDSFIKEGKWTGEHALAQLREFDGPDAVLHADRQHFWPYGLNYDEESDSDPEADRRHVLMVAAFRRDLGIVSEPIKGMIGVGTWETQAEFKDIKVTKGDQTLYASDFSKGMEGWETEEGKWEISDDALRQTSSAAGPRAVTGDPSWGDYTLTLKARKVGGNEGFIIYFGLPDEKGGSRWNLGGWGNTQYALDVTDGISVHQRGRIESDRWYDIRIEIRGPKVKAYLDGELVQEARR